MIDKLIFALQVIAYLLFAIAVGFLAYELVRGIIKHVQAIVTDLRAIDDNNEPPAFI